MLSRGSRFEFLRRASGRWGSARGVLRQCLTPDDGFTLIEVLVTIAVLALVLGAIGAVVGTTAKGVRSVDRRLPLLETAQSLLASLPDRAALQPGTRSGATGDILWRIDVAPLVGQRADASPSAKWIPLLVTVRVQASEGPPVRLDTIRLVPRPGA